MTDTPLRLAQARSAWRITHKQFVLVFVLLIAAVSTRTEARPTTETEATRAVKRWMDQDARPLGAGLHGAMAKAQAVKGAQGEAEYYVVPLTPEGFVIVAGDDLVEPIVAFSPTGHYDTQTSNPLHTMVKRDLPRRVGHVRARRKGAQGKGAAPANDDQESKAQKKWGRLTQAVAPALALAPSAGKIDAISDLRVAPFVESQWDQALAPNGYGCYNYYTPPGAPGARSNYPCGCVATAMAQIMRYHQYPTAGVGTKSFQITYDGKAKTESLRGGDGAGGAYAWENMPFVLTMSVTSAQRLAIGALTHDAATAVNMDYAAEGSGAYVYDAAAQFVSTFKFSNAIYGWANGDSIPTQHLGQMVNPNLDARLPVLFGIMGAGNSGHAVVCDGYGYNLGTPYHHLNMGWSGQDDTWYNLPNIDAATYPFNVVDECIYNIYTSGKGEIISGRALDADGKPVAGARVTATRTGGGAYNATSDEHGIYAFAKLPSASTYQITVQKSGLFFESQAASTGRSVTEGTQGGNQWGVTLKASGKTAVKAWAAFE